VVRNSRDLDRYMLHRFDVTLVEFQGRGHEHFSDEIQRLFDWMNRRERDFFPAQFKTVSMRPWDNFFWWVEMHGLPERAIVLPINWPPKRAVQPARLDATAVAKSNTISVTCAGERATIWLSPELVDLDRPVKITVNGRKLGPADARIEPDLSVMLEDARTRGERQHPFWAKVE
jgi:hypothetical protein